MLLLQVNMKNVKKNKVMILEMIIKRMRKDLEAALNDFFCCYVISELIWCGLCPEYFVHLSVPMVYSSAQLFSTFYVFV